jgi:hypothetical protein
MSMAEKLIFEPIYLEVVEERDEARAHIRELEAKVDALMLEYCPDEMTPEQRQRWAAHQQPVDRRDEHG